ncbi:MAG: CbiX/SirB N-terminal domain-containing protein [Burkholderiaceae bacterium]|nr:CbiX/SirB N-terminal domain-containing protein [Burkholderiaceae bacterium]
MADAAQPAAPDAGAGAALILFAHGARDVAWREPVDALAQRLRRLLPRVDVVPAFLERMRPSLAEAVDAAVARGAARIAVAPVFWAQGGHLKHDVPALLAHVCATHPEVRIDLWPVLGERDAVLDAIAADYRGLWANEGASGEPGAVGPLSGSRLSK